MEQRALKSVNNCLNTNIYSYLEKSGSESSNLYLNVVHFFNTSVNQTSVATQDNYFPALLSNTCCFIDIQYYCQVSFMNFMMSVSIKSSMASVIMMSVIMLNTMAPNEGEMSFSTIQLERSHRQTTFTLLYRF